jgi:hypothetical protein
VTGKTVAQLAKFYVDLSNLTFDKVGSLYPHRPTRSKQHGAVGPLVSLDFKSLVSPYFFGPFASSAERYIAQIDHVLAGIEAKELMLDDPEPVHTYIVHLWLRDAIKSSKELNKDEEIMLKHGDDKGDQIMVDGDGNIVSILDWEL